MSYRIEFAKSALRQLASLPRTAQLKIKTQIDALERDPRPVGCKKLKGEENLYRVRAGSYRVIYRIRDDVLVVLVVKIGDRKEVYRRIK